MNLYTFLGFCSLVIVSAAVYVSAAAPHLVSIALVFSLDCAILAVGAAILAREQ